LLRRISGKKDPTILTFKTLLSRSITPPNYSQKTTSPTTLFLAIPIKQKSLVKQISLNFSKTFAYTAFQRILPTIFEHYANWPGKFLNPSGFIHSFLKATAVMQAYGFCKNKFFIFKTNSLSMFRQLCRATF
jgi:hypothetical protein